MEAANPDSKRPPRSRVCALVQYFAAVTSGVFAAGIGPRARTIFIAFVACCLASFLAITFRWKWLVPCVVLGFLIGMFELDPKAQTEEMCMNAALGTFVGLMIGIVADSQARRPSAIDAFSAPTDTHEIRNTRSSQS